MVDRPDVDMPDQEPWLAVLLSKLWPGVGQLYAGAWLKAIIFALGYFLLTAWGVWSLWADTGSTAVGLVALLLSFVIFLISLFDAYRSIAKKNTEAFITLRKSQKDPWLATFLSTWLPGLGHLYLGKWLVGIGFFLGFLVLAGVMPLALQGLLGLVGAAIAYHAYISSPPRRGSSQRLILIVCAVIAALSVLSPSASTIRANVAEARYIPSQAMLPTLQVNDRVLVDKLIYRSQAPQRGDIIVFTAPDAAMQTCGLALAPGRQANEALIQRIIGLPGETVEIKQGNVSINGRPLQEDYIQAAPKQQYAARRVPAQSYFVLGDNRDNSCDSVYWGFVSEANLIGRARKIFWPLERVRPLSVSYRN